jgi:predicted small secreted protein
MDGSALAQERTILETLMLRLIAMSALALGALALTGCNTVKGFGRDVESVGQAGDDAL